MKYTDMYILVEQLFTVSYHFKCFVLIKLPLLLNVVYDKLLYSKNKKNICHINSSSILFVQVMSHFCIACYKVVI